MDANEIIIYLGRLVSICGRKFVSKKQNPFGDPAVLSA